MPKLSFNTILEDWGIFHVHLETLDEETLSLMEYLQKNLTTVSIFYLGYDIYCDTFAII